MEHHRQRATPTRHATFIIRFQFHGLHQTFICNECSYNSGRSVSIATLYIILSVEETRHEKFPLFRVHIQLH